MLFHMTSMIQRVKVPDSKIPKYDRTVYASYFDVQDVTGQTPGLVHEEVKIGDGEVLSGTRFGGVFEVAGSPLTKGQTRVLAMIAMGVRPYEIAESEYVSILTVRTHVRNIGVRLGTTSIAGAVNQAFAGPNAFFQTVEYGEPINELTAAQKRIVKTFVGSSSVSRDVAKELGLSHATVATHIKDVNRILMLSGDNHVSITAMAHLTDTVIDHSND